MQTPVYRILISFAFLVPAVAGLVASAAPPGAAVVPPNSILVDHGALPPAAVNDVPAVAGRPAAATYRATGDLDAHQRAEIVAQAGQIPCAGSQPMTLMSLSRVFDPNPMRRPIPVALIKADRQTLLNKIQSIFNDAGYAVEVNPDTGEVAGVKNDPTQQNASDQLLVWIDGQAGDANTVRVYLEYGRFEPFFGMPEPRRVVTTNGEEQQKTGVVRTAIQSL